MHQVLTLNKILNKISPAGLSQLDPEKYTHGDNVENPDAVIVRSAKMHDMELPESLLAIARAGAGTNNIPVDKCTDKGIVVFNTPGANANAVKELVICGLFLASRKIIPGIDFANSLKGTGDDYGKQVEKGKSAFKGPEIQGKKLGVIGLGAIGVQVANAAKGLGMEVAAKIDEIFANCDYITVHVPLNDQTKDTINAESIDKMKDGVRILNFARGGLVNTEDMIAALGKGKVASYITDFAEDELLGVPGVVAMPHLGASTPESEDNCAHMAAFELANYLESGNIRNSVNLPNAEMPCNAAHRLTIIHKNVPNVLNKVTGLFTDANISDFMNRSKGDIAYTILDIDTDISEELIDSVKALDGVVRVRLIK